MIPSNKRYWEWVREGNVAAHLRAAGKARAAAIKKGMSEKNADDVENDVYTAELARHRGLVGFDNWKQLTISAKGENTANKWHNKVLRALRKTEKKSLKQGMRPQNAVKAGLTAAELKIKELLAERPEGGSRKFTRRLPRHLYKN